MSEGRGLGRKRSGTTSPIAVGLAVLGAMLSACSSSHLTSVPTKDRPTVSEATSCAQDHPTTWMGCLVKADPAFGTRPISGLAIPGSANAGTFNLDLDSFDTQPGSACTDYVPQDASLGSTLGRWFETQNDAITEQLDLGVRFLDLQVAYIGDGNALKGWRVVQSQYSEVPLYDYLDQVADWAKSHRSEVVVVDLRDVCYDNQPDRADDEGLFANFATPSDVGEGTTTLADVAFDPGSSSRSFATDTIDQVTQQGGGGHNVVVLLPDDLRDSSVLSSRYHTKAVFTVNAGSSEASSNGALPVEFADAEVAPTSAAMVEAANSELASYPLATTPKMGTLVGRGLYEANLAYSFDPSDQTALLAGFGGLIQPYTPSGTKGVPVTLPAWEVGLWNPTAPGALSLTQILAGWGHRANVVLADGVEDAGFISAVIGLNAR